MASSDATHTHHAIDYIELTVNDLAAAKKFYTAAFEWGFNDYGPGYAGIKGAGGREAGGLREDKNVHRDGGGGGNGPLVILYSRALEATVKSVVDAGGRVIKAPYEFPGGRRFHFVDPSGNELAAWSEK